MTSAVSSARSRHVRARRRCRSAARCMPIALSASSKRSPKRSGRPCLLSLRVEVDVDRLQLREPLDRLPTALAPQARQLDAAHGRIRNARVVVYADRAAAYGARHPECATDVSGVDATRQAVVAVI